MLLTFEYTIYCAIILGAQLSQSGMPQSIEFENLTLTDKIYSLIKLGVIHQEYLPGSRLADQEIAERLGVSRTPVREAINRLAAEGLVTIIPRQGAFVTELSQESIKEIYEIREVLESLAVQLAIPSRNDDELSTAH
jgi:DNA-binding GntR family transcriptional regulator